MLEHIALIRPESISVKQSINTPNPIFLSHIETRSTQKKQQKKKKREKKKRRDRKSKREIEEIPIVAGRGKCRLH